MKIQSARSSLHVRGRKINVTQALVCTGTVIGGFNMVNKGKYAPVTLEHRVYTPTRLPSFLSFCCSLGLRNIENINAVEVQSGSDCPCSLKHHKTRKTIQWQSGQKRNRKLGRLARKIALYLLQTSGPKLHLGNGLWLAKLIEKRGGWGEDNRMKCAGTRREQVWLCISSPMFRSPLQPPYPLPSHLYLSLCPVFPPDTTPPFCLFPPLHNLIGAASPPLLPLNHLTIRQEDCCSWCIIVPTTPLCWSLTLIP